MEMDLIRQTGSQIPFAAVSAAALRGRAPWTLARNLVVLGRGIRQAAGLLKRFAPQAVLVTGGYVTIPVGVAAWRRRIPLLTYLPDIVPGLAVRFLARLASRVATTAPDSTRYLPHGKAVAIGYPVRPELLQTDRRQARAHWGVADGQKALLIYGGSRGARSINQAVAADLPAFLQRAIVIHICGREGDEVWLRQRADGLPADLRARYHLHPYLHEGMVEALVAADVTICRAGASTLGELPAVGLPAILVPYPYVHQEENADYLVGHGAAIKVPDARLRGAEGRPDASALLQALQTILDDPAVHQRMVEAARGLARPHAAQAVVEQLRSLAGDMEEAAPRPDKGGE